MRQVHSLVSPSPVFNTSSKSPRPILFDFFLSPSFLAFFNPFLQKRSFVHPSCIGECSRTLFSTWACRSVAKWAYCYPRKTLLCLAHHRHFLAISFERNCVLQGIIFLAAFSRRTHSFSLWEMSSKPSLAHWSPVRSQCCVILTCVICGLRHLSMLPNRKCLCVTPLRFYYNQRKYVDHVFLERHTCIEGR